MAMTWIQLTAAWMIALLLLNKLFDLRDITALHGFALPDTFSQRSWT